MKALKITSSDATCVGATISRGFSFSSIQDDKWAAVPDILAHAASIEDVAAKHGDSFIRLGFSDGSSTEVKSFCCDSPEEAIQEAVDNLNFDGVEEDDLEWWENCR